MTLIETLLISIYIININYYEFNICTSFLILFNYYKITNLENTNTNLINTNKDFENKNKIIENINSEMIETIKKLENKNKELKFIIKNLEYLNQKNYDKKRI